MLRGGQAATLALPHKGKLPFQKTLNFQRHGVNHPVTDLGKAAFTQGASQISGARPGKMQCEPRACCFKKKCLCGMMRIRRNSLRIRWGEERSLSCRMFPLKLQKRQTAGFHFRINLADQ